MSVFQELYDSEINFSVSCFWDGGFRVQIGDSINGIRAEDDVLEWKDVGPWLTREAIKAWPESDFARARK